ncbi:hypothetical protein C1H46_040374 [Malus baccata]|uniref:J domain-containing protein n=1 Tax=Malus baccata TaxID=106549 RepID=A0A540KIU7_MALBA|nr:hypothetical protein C1H46_040374 [Malus baccata]
MAFTAAPPQASHTLFLRSPPATTTATRARTATTARRTRSHVSVHVYASQGPSNRERAPPGVDTRIHWENDDEGWIGGSSSRKEQAEQEPESEQQRSQRQSNLLGDKFADLLNDSISDSHYQFLGVSAEADLEEIKAAYRRLSKEYHPDTTSLPLKTASDKFVRLREIYDVLSNEESRKFYNWTLAQEAASRQAEIMRMKLEDPYVKAVETYKPVPDMVDRLGGKNMALGDQAMTALTIDVLIIVFAICCIAYVIFFKEPYY